MEWLEAEIWTANSTRFYLAYILQLSPVSKERVLFWWKEKADLSRRDGKESGILDSPLPGRGLQIFLSIESKLWLLSNIILIFITGRYKIHINPILMSNKWLKILRYEITILSTLTWGVKLRLRVRLGKRC